MEPIRKRFTPTLKDKLILNFRIFWSKHYYDILENVILLYVGFIFVMVIYVGGLYLEKFFKG